MSRAFLLPLLFLKSVRSKYEGAELHLSLDRPKHIAIRNLTVEERPREKLLKHGVESLADAELLGLVLASGTPRVSALELSRELLAHFGGIESLSRAAVEDLLRLPGIGFAKSMKLVAAFELGRRRQAASHYRVKVKEASDVGKYMVHRIGHYETEVFVALYLNRANEIKAEKTISRGGVHATVIDTRVIFREALKHLATAVIVVHNHPSGNINPSQADIEITKKLKAAGEYLDIPLLDHVIVSDRGYFSFVTEGLLNEK